MNIALLFIVFNRPEITERVFNKIKEAKPRRLYIAADGPRAEYPDDVEKCDKVRKLVLNIDWDCEIKTLFRDQNLGCKLAVSSAIDWFFYNEEMGIILEDDCLPERSFFEFCEALLLKYKDDSRIMHINGNNYGADIDAFSESNYSYHFGYMPQVWGWATWKRAWAYFDKSMSNYKEFTNVDYLNRVFLKKWHVSKQLERWSLVANKDEDIWGFQWQFSVISNHGLTVMPKKNLISNIGFGEGATHTSRVKSDKSEIATTDIEFPLVHPSFVLPDQKIDFWYQEHMLGSAALFNRLLVRVKSIIKQILFIN